MSDIQINIQHIQQAILQAEQAYHRPMKSVRLLAVSKTQAAESILQAIESGIYQFGENYVQEGVDKITEISRHHTDSDAPEQTKVEWHFIGPIQSNKTRLIAEYFDWVHSVSREKIAQRLSEQCPANKKLQVLIQVNISQENTKSGATVDEIFQLAQYITQCPNLTLRGLMAIPQPCTDFEQQKHTFDRVKQLFDQLTKRYPTVDTLSMGMSADMDAAIAAGSTMVRIGTAIFGQRT